MVPRSRTESRPLGGLDATGRDTSGARSHAAGSDRRARQGQVRLLPLYWFSRETPESPLLGSGDRRNVGGSPARHPDTRNCSGQTRRFFGTRPGAHSRRSGSPEDAIEKEAASVQRRMDQAYMDKLDEKTSEDFWKRQYEQLQNENVRIRGAINALRSPRPKCCSACLVLLNSHKGLTLCTLRKILVNRLNCSNLCF